MPFPQQATAYLSHPAAYGMMPPPAMPPAQQPVMFNGQAYVPVQQPPAQTPMMGIPMGVTTPVMAAPAAAATGVPLVPPPGNNPPITTAIPDVAGLGKTPAEETLRQVQFAYDNGLFEPQDFKPADDNPSRYYYVREVDGNWTQRNRFAIDHMGDCRWYVTDEGWFYAVRLPD